MNLNFCRVVLLGVVSHYFLQDFIRIIAISPSWEKKRFPEVHTFLFKTEPFQITQLSPDLEIFFFFFPAVLHVATCLIPGILKSTRVPLAHLLYLYCITAQTKH